MDAAHVRALEQEEARLRVCRPEEDARVPVGIDADPRRVVAPDLERAANVARIAGRIRKLYLRQRGWADWRSGEWHTFRMADGWDVAERRIFNPLGLLRKSRRWSWFRLFTKEPRHYSAWYTLFTGEMVDAYFRESIGFVVEVGFPHGEVHQFDDAHEVIRFVRGLDHALRTGGG